MTTPSVLFTCKLGAILLHDCQWEANPVSVYNTQLNYGSCGPLLWITVGNIGMVNCHKNPLYMENKIDPQLMLMI